MSRKLGLAFVLFFMVPIIANAQSIPAGVSVINGYFNSTSSSTYPVCYGILYDSVTGYLTNPGPGRVGTKVELTFAYCDGGCDGAGIVMTVSNFPAQPSIGLNGWTSTLPALATQTEYLNGQVILSAQQDVYFTLTPITSTISQGTMVISNAGCPQSVNLIITHPPQ